MATAPARRSAKDRPRCRWCGRVLPERDGPGRPRVYCKQGCRQSAFLARKLADAHGLAEGDVVVRRDELEELAGLIYCLETALDDVRGDLRISSTKKDLEEALRWLRDNAAPLAAFRLEPRQADL